MSTFTTSKSEYYGFETAVALSGLLMLNAVVSVIFIAAFYSVCRSTQWSTINMSHLHNHTDIFGGIRIFSLLNMNSGVSMFSYHN